MITGFKTVKEEIEDNDWFVIGNWTQNLENAEFFKTFREALIAQTENNKELIIQNRLNECDMYEIFETSSISS